MAALRWRLVATLLVLLVDVAAVRTSLIVHRPFVSRHTPPRAAAAQEDDGDAATYRLPLFAPSEPVAFPFPAPPELATRLYRYSFDTPAHLRLLRSAEDSLDREPLFGHCLSTATSPGGVGVTVRLAGPSTSEFGGQIATATVAASGRFVVQEVVSSFPFPVALVLSLHDEEEEPTAAAAALEAEVVQALSKLATQSMKLVAALGDDEAAAAALLAPAALLEAHEERTASGSDAERRARLEALSLGGCELIALPPAVAERCLTTVSSTERLRLLAGALRPLLAELDAVLALGAPREAAAGLVGGAPGQPWKLRPAHAAPRHRLPSGFQPVDIPLAPSQPAAPAAPGATVELPAGSRIEFWWNEEWGWCAATVKRVLRLAGGRVLHSLEFDSDGSWEDAALEFDDGGKRWRPLGPRRDVAS